MLRFPKELRAQNPRLREMARRYGCQMLWKQGCLGDDTSTTVLAHDNALASGKGMGRKSHDHLGVYSCHVCHSALDQGRHDTGEEKAAAFARGLVRQVQLYGQIAASPTTRAKDRAAAAWALEQLASYEPA